VRRGWRQRTTRLFRPDQAACGVAAPCSVTRAPPLVRAPCPSRCPRLGPGGMRCRSPAPGDRPVPAAVAPQPPAGGRTRSPAARLTPRPGCRDVGTARARPSSAPGQSGAVSCPPCRYRCGPVRRSAPRLRRSPGPDGHPRSCRPGLAEMAPTGLPVPCGQPLVPTGIHGPFESFRIRSST
jgi:hypothetical protein